MSGPRYAQAHQVDRFQRLGFNVLQQPPVYPDPRLGFHLARGLGINQLEPELVSCGFLLGTEMISGWWTLTCPDLVSPPAQRGFLLFAMAFSGAAAVFISYTTAWCIRVTSSTTYRYVVL